MFRGSDTESIAGLSLEVRTAIAPVGAEGRCEERRRQTRRCDRNKLLINIQYQALDTNDRRNLVFPFYTIPDDGSDY